MKKTIKNIKRSLLFHFFLFLLLLSLGLALSIYFKENKFTKGISLISVIIWQLSLWMPLILVAPLFFKIWHKTEKISNLRKWSCSIIFGLLFIVLHYFWFYLISNKISPYLNVPKTKYGVFPFFFVFWILIDFIIVFGILMYIKNTHKIINYNLKKSMPNSIYVKQGSKKFLLIPDDIIWVEAQDYYIKIYSSKGKFLKRQTLKSFLQILPENKFIKVHRSTIVNIECITHFRFVSSQKGEVTLKDGNKRIVSRSYLNNINQLFSD